MAISESDTLKNYVLIEGFDDEWLPTNWSKIDFHPTENWVQANPDNSMLEFDKIDPNSKFSAIVQWLPENQNEWLITPQIVTDKYPATLHWYAGVSGPWLSDATLRCLISTDGGISWTEIWNAIDHISSNSDWSWNKILLNLNEFADKPFQIAWNYVGNDGDIAGVDGIRIQSGEDYIYVSDFEEYSLGNMVALNDTTGLWTTWNNDPGSYEDAFIVDSYANSPTKSVEIADSNNLILRLGDKTEGKYILRIKYFIENGKSAGFIVNHYEQAGAEEAFSIIFKASGEGHINAGNPEAHHFTFPNNEWITLSVSINLDDDWTEFYINDELTFQWPFHYQSTSEDGILQLGGINFKSFEPQSDSSGFYFDDIEIVAIESPISPQLYVSDTSFTAILPEEGISENELRIGNLGIQDLKYKSVLTYFKATESPFHNSSRSLLIQNSDPNSLTSDTTLNYDGENASAIGNNNSDYNWQIASMFPSELVKPHIGREIFKVDIYINDLPLESTIQIFDMGSFISGQPGGLIYEQEFIPVATSWNSIVLDSSIYLCGKDIWVGCKIKGDQGSFVPGIDVGPANMNGDWISFGDKWEHLKDNSELNANWNIRAYLKGETIAQWLSISEYHGTLKQYEYKDQLITIDGTHLTSGDYYGELLLRNNDPKNDEQAIEFHLTIISDINNHGDSIQVLVYPNPTSEYIVIESNEVIKEITLLNSNGKVLISQKLNQNKTSLNTSAFSPGIYILQLETKKGGTTMKIVVK